MIRNVRYYLNSMFLGCVILIFGCSSPNMETVPEQPVTSFPHLTELDGLVIGVDIFAESKRIKKHFGANLLDRGVLPVRVGFKNVSAQGAYLLQPGSVVLMGQTYEQQNANYPVVKVKSEGAETFEQIAGAGGGVPMALFPLITVPIGLVLGENIKDWRDIAYNMERIRFNDKPLYKSDSNSGFLYFKLSQDGDSAKVKALEFRVKDIYSQSYNSIIIRIQD